MSLLQPELTLEEAINNALHDQVPPQETVIDFEAVAAEVINPQDPSVPNKRDKKEFLDVLTNSGASLEAAARRLNQVVNFPESEAMGLKAAEMIFKAHGLLKEAEKDIKKVPEVSITIVGTSGQTMINLLMPK